MTRDVDKVQVFRPADVGEFLIVARVFSHQVDYVCYNCCGMEQDASGNFTIPLYEVEDAFHGCETTPDHVKAQTYLSGHVKWDGCANLKFDEQETIMLHFCGRADAARVGKLLDRLYDLTAELLPTFEEKMGRWP